MFHGQDAIKTRGPCQALETAHTEIIHALHNWQGMTSINITQIKHLKHLFLGQFVMSSDWSAYYVNWKHHSVSRPTAHYSKVMNIVGCDIKQPGQV